MGLGGLGKFNGAYNVERKSNSLSLSHTYDTETIVCELAKRLWSIRRGLSFSQGFPLIARAGYRGIAEVIIDVYWVGRRRLHPGAQVVALARRRGFAGGSPVR